MNNLDFAKELATLSTFDKYKIAALVLDRKGNILSFGVNVLKTHPRQKHYAIRAGHPAKEYLHAEIAALVRCRHDPYSLLVVRITGRGLLANSAPCDVCRLAIVEAGIKVVEYSDRTGNLVKEKI